MSTADPFGRFGETSLRPPRNVAFGDTDVANRGAMNDTLPSCGGVHGATAAHDTTSSASESCTDGAKSFSSFEDPADPFKRPHN